MKDQIAQLVLKLTQSKFALKRRRLEKQVNAQEIRKEIYILSTEINKLEKEIDGHIVELNGGSYDG